MDFADTLDEASFRAEVRAWLRENAELRPQEGAARADPKAQMARARAFLAAKAARGYAAITWPKEYGGYGGTEMHRVIFHQEQARFDIDTFHGSDFFNIGLELCGSTILRCATDAQKQRFLPPLVRGEEIWCQLFSEPSAGSDLAGIRTKAVREGDGWRITGQKIWTTLGQFADFGLALTRTDPTVPKHRGLTMFVVNMHDPGVDVRPIRQMSGEAEFNQIFLDNVWVPDDHRIGAVNDGWKVALATLGQERSTAGDLKFLDCGTLLELAKSTCIGGRPALADGRVRERLVECWLAAFGTRLMSYRSQTALARGSVPGPEESIAKPIITQQAQRAAILAMDLLGPSGALISGTLGEGWSPVEHSFFWSPAFRIAGGTDEVLRNIIAERVLGLPSDIRVDRDIPFNQLTGANG
ncbi:Acyl-CoA dehydrogenase [Rhizobiales bacterium GAS191]|nr:Acyl-CoA dehydrogenase [Rhizobiales bacterium GAS191]